MVMAYTLGNSMSRLLNTYLISICKKEGLPDAKVILHSEIPLPIYRKWWKRFVFWVSRFRIVPTWIFETIEPDDLTPRNMTLKVEKLHNGKIYSKTYAYSDFYFAVQDFRSFLEYDTMQLAREVKEAIDNAKP